MPILYQLLFLTPGFPSRRDLRIRDVPLMPPQEWDSILFLVRKNFMSSRLACTNRGAVVQWKRERQGTPRRLTTPSVNTLTVSSQHHRPTSEELMMYFEAVVHRRKRRITLLPNSAYRVTSFEDDRLEIRSPIGENHVEGAPSQIKFLRLSISPLIYGAKFKIISKGQSLNIPTSCPVATCAKCNDQRSRPAEKTYEGAYESFRPRGNDLIS